MIEFKLLMCGLIISAVICLGFTIKLSKNLKWLDKITIIALALGLLYFGFSVIFK